MKNIFIIFTPLVLLTFILLGSSNSVFAYHSHSSIESTNSVVYKKGYRTLDGYKTLDIDSYSIEYSNPIHESYGRDNSYGRQNGYKRQYSHRIQDGYKTLDTESYSIQDSNPIQESYGRDNSYGRQNGYNTSDSESYSIQDSNPIQDSYGRDNSYINTIKTPIQNSYTSTDPTNLILNSGFETSNGSLPLNWSNSFWGTNISNFYYPVLGYLSNVAAKIDVTSYTDGDAKWFFDDVNVIAGNDYTFSDVYESSVDTNLTARYKMTDGTYTYSYLGIAPKTVGWNKFSTTFTIPSGVVGLTIFHTINSFGNLTIDDAKLTTAVKDQFTQGMISFVFDDGFKSIYNLAIPILDASGIKATVAVLPGTFSYPDYMSEQEVKNVYYKGHEIASHSINHVDLTKVPLGTATDEIVQSKSMLSAIGVNSNIFIYPYGEYNSIIIELLKSSGYIGARTAQEGLNSPTSDRFQLKDLHVESTTTWETIKASIDNAIAEKKWVVLEMHAQGTNLGQYSNDPALLQTIVNYVKQQNIKTVTLTEGVNMMK